MSNRKLSAADEARILTLTGQGRTSRQISETLGTVGHAAVSKFLNRSKATRADAAKSIVRTALVGSLTSDIDGLEAERARLVKIARSFGAALLAAKQDVEETGDAFSRRFKRASSTYFEALSSLAKITDLKLHYSGAGEPDGEPDDKAAADKVLAKIEAMIESHEPEPPPEVH